MFLTKLEFEEIQGKLPITAKLKVVKYGFLVYGIDRNLLENLKEKKEDCRVEMLRKSLVVA